jgi:hypothetical protein
MKRLTATLIATFFAATALAQANPQEAQVSGSAKPKAVAEDIHLARTHGLGNIAPMEAQKAGSAKAQAVAEDIHLRKQHGNVNTYADELMLKHASRL